MPFYKDIKFNTREGKRITERLLLLRQSLAAQIPQKKLEENLLLATWNIREFDSPAYGDRITEAFYYIAEIISKFDLVAVQEVRKDLIALKKLCAILGGYWKYIVSDVTEGHQGNKERVAFLYDSRKVVFGGLAGELVLPPVKDKDGNYVPVEQIARTPLICGFKCGWTDFMIATVHIIYGENKADSPARIKEIEEIADFLKKRVTDKSAWSSNLILLGDFNNFNKSSKAIDALNNAGFEVPDELQKPSNALKNKYYDQIVFRKIKNKFIYTGSAGVFDYYETVFTESDEKIYAKYMGDAYLKTSTGKVRDDKRKTTYYKTYWRTFQMSYHLVMWAELGVNYSDEYLERKLSGN